MILQNGRDSGKFKLTDVEAAAGVVRDAVTSFIHPVHVQAAAKAGMSLEPGFAG